MRLFYRILIAVFLVSLGGQTLVAKEFSKKEQKLIEKYQAFLNSSLKLEVIDYNLILEKKADSSFVIKVINPDKMVKTHEVNYSASPVSLRHGTFTEWYDNGKLWKKGQYAYGQKQGLWRFYTDKGEIIKAGNFVNDKKEGFWIFQTEDVKKKTHYKNNKKEGLFTKYINDTLFQKKEYHNDTLVNVWVDKNPYCEEMPSYRGGYKKIIKHLSKYMKFPTDASKKNIEGQVILKFVVEESGEIGEVIVDRGVCKSIEKAALKGIEKLHKFKPGMKGGKPVRVWYRIPLKFQLYKENSRIKYWIYEE